MRVAVDDSRRQHESFAVDDAACGAKIGADRGDAPGGNGEVGAVRRAAEPVDEVSATDEQIMHERETILSGAWRAKLQNLDTYSFVCRHGRA